LVSTPLQRARPHVARTAVFGDGSLSSSHCYCSVRSSGPQTAAPTSSFTRRRQYQQRRIPMGSWRRMLESPASRLMNHIWPARQYLATVVLVAFTATAQSDPLGGRRPPPPPASHAGVNTSNAASHRVAQAADHRLRLSATAGPQGFCNLSGYNHGLQAELQLEVRKCHLDAPGMQPESQGRRTRDRCVSQQSTHLQSL